MKYTVFFSFLILLASCGNDPNLVVKQLETEVIAIHDEVMPKTNDIHKLKKELKNRLEDTQDSTVIFDLIKELDDADEFMMVWMDQYQKVDMAKDTSENMSYLRDQKVKIIEVKEAMLNSIKNTEEYLKN